MSFLSRRRRTTIARIATAITAATIRMRKISGRPAPRGEEFETAAVTESRVEALAVFPAPSVTVTVIVKFPLVAGVQDRLAVLELMHPGGRPTYPYVNGPTPPATTTSRVADWP